jgi:hypothetical protein
MADQIKNLPTSQEQPSDVDMNVMREIFGDGVNVAKSLQLKKIIIPAIMFVVLSLPMIDNFLKTIVPDSDAVLIFVKTLIFLVMLALFQLISM